jgi:hypothetical protein
MRLRGPARPFELGRRFDAALCPINSFTYLLTRESAAAHLACVARHLAPGAPYVVQVDLVDTATHQPGPGDRFSDWIVEAEGLRLSTTVSGTDWNPETCVESELMRFELLEGPGAGRVLEDRQEMRLWSWREWSALIEASPFEQVGAHDGRYRGRHDLLDVGPGLEGVRLCIHELRLPP